MTQLPLHLDVRRALLADEEASQAILAAIAAGAAAEAVFERLGREIGNALRARGNQERRRHASEELHCIRIRDPVCFSTLLVTGAVLQVLEKELAAVSEDLEAIATNVFEAAAAIRRVRTKYLDEATDNHRRRDREGQGGQPAGRVALSG